MDKFNIRQYIRNDFMTELKRVEISVIRMSEIIGKS